MPHLSLERRPMHSRAVNPTSQAQLMNIKEVWCYKPPEGSSSHLFNINETRLCSRVGVSAQDW